MRWLALAGVAVGCVGTTPPGHDDGQFGEESGAGCEVVSRTAIDLDEVSPLGFTAREVLDLAEGAHEAELAWVQLEEVAALTLTVAQVGPVEYLEQAVVDDGVGGAQEPAFAEFCPNVLSVGVEIGFTTDDGAFAEQWSGALIADVADQTGFGRELEDLAGTFDPWDHAPSGSTFDEVAAWLDVRFDAVGASGIVHGQGSAVVGDPNDPDSTAYAENFDIATFGEPADP